MVGGLPKESTEERYWDSADGEELPRDPLSGSPWKPWYISPQGPRDAGTPAVTRERATSPAAQRCTGEDRETRDTETIISDEGLIRSFGQSPNFNRHADQS